MTTISGINSVATRLKRDASGIDRLLLRQGKLGKRLSDIESLANQAGVPVERVPEAVLDAIHPSHQGVGLVLAGGGVGGVGDRGLVRRIDEILETAVEPLLLLILDGVTDPRNLGACVRSAATMGVHAVIVPKDNSASMTDAAIKTASGGASMVPVIEVVNLARTIERLKDGNVWVVGTQLEAKASLSDVDLAGNIAIVLGSEDKGLRKNTANHCDFLARIPMATDELGFNVSVAAGICLYETYRQRH